MQHAQTVSHTLLHLLKARPNWSVCCPALRKHAKDYVQIEIFFVQNVLKVNIADFYTSAQEKASKFKICSRHFFASSDSSISRKISKADGLAYN